MKLGEGVDRCWSSLLRRRGGKLEVVVTISRTITDYTAAGNTALTKINDVLFCLEVTAVVWPPTAGIQVRASDSVTVNRPFAVRCICM